MDSMLKSCFIHACGITVYRFQMPGIESNAYVLITDAEAMVVDPHVCKQMEELLDSQNVRKLTVLLTHEHFDHISGINRLRERYSIQVLCTDRCAQSLQNPEETLAAYWELLLSGKPPGLRAFALALGDKTYRTYADESFSDQLTRQWHGQSLHLITAPGHSPGGMIITLNEQFVFTGDSLVNGSQVICSFPGGSRSDYIDKTMPLLRDLPDSMLVLPGHGDVATLGALREFCAPMEKKRRKT